MSLPFDVTFKVLPRIPKINYKLTVLKGLLDSEDKDTTLLRFTGKYPPTDTA
jgi:hypothetical protein